MQTVLYFDFCSIPIFIIILITVFVRRMTRGISNKMFIMLLILSSLSAISDVIMEYAYRELPISPERMLTAQLSSYLYFICRNASVYLYTFFIFSITGTWYRVKSFARKVIVSIPFALLILILLSNPFTGIVFDIAADKGYSRGSCIFILYLISLLYAVFGTIYLLSCSRFITKDKLIPLISLYFFVAGGAVFQYFFPQYLVEMISTSMSTILLILFVLRPEEISDASVGSLSFDAYRLELQKILYTKQRVKIAFLNITNATELRSYLGEERYLSYVSHVITQLDIKFTRERIFFGIYFEHPGTIMIIVDDDKFDIKAAFRNMYGEIRRNFDKLAISGERMNVKACSLVIPDDLTDCDEIIRFGRSFASQMPASRMFADASELISSNDYKMISNIDSILNRAISENRFRMYYQPIYSFERGRFISAEALIRLNDDEYGSIPPGLFIPAAEKRGVILPIGDFVLEDVHRFISENDFDALGLEYIEINLSVAQCLQEELPVKLALLSDRYGVSPDKVNLEITETTYEEVGTVMETNLAALTGMGYTFSLDDYGTGYSNMQRVSKLPLKMVKLDKSLVDDMATEDGRSIVRNTVKMMRDIDKELVAEGVETKDRLDELEKMGCHFIQGYYFSKPLPADKFIAFIKEHNVNTAK
ncbi:MAG: EAL domain-containing protein [Ruminiclostridium sp.]|nr:EAL domain-containing protein [Ruminiclostridium sp.]